MSARLSRRSPWSPRRSRRRRCGAGYVLPVKLRKVPDTLGRETTWKIVSARERPARAPSSPASSSARRGPRPAPTAPRARSSTRPTVASPGRTPSLWAVTAGIGLGIAKLISARLAVVGWEAATGTLPPGVEEPVEI